MRKASQTASRGRVVVKGVGDAVVRGAGTHKNGGGKQVRGTETYDHRALSFRKLNNADPGPKI